MGVSLDKMLARLPPERRSRIEARAEELIAEEMSLAALRKARKLTQQKVAKILGIRQESVSSIENRADLLISTLRGYVQAAGGTLSLQVTFPDHPTVEISSFGNKIVKRGTGRRKASTKRSAAQRRMIG